MDMVFIYILIALFFIVDVVVIFYIIASIIGFARFGVPYVKANPKAVEKILELADIKPGDSIYDLGAGNGQFIIKADKDYSARAVGFEKSIWPYLMAKFNIWRKKSKARIYYKDFLKEDLGHARVLIAFLMPKPCACLRAKLDKELKPGVTVFSYAFQLKDWRSGNVKERIIKDKEFPSWIYVYQRTVGSEQQDRK